MKIITKILLKSLKHDNCVDVRKFLREKLNNKTLTDEQVRYLIKNLNKNTYILQNIYPVVKAIEKGISIDVIEECANLLDDASGLSIFALKDGEGFLYNKVPYDLDKLLELDLVERYSSYKKFHINDDNFWLNKIKEITECLNQSYQLNTISSELFWEIIQKDSSDIDCIAKYNEHLKEYLKKNSIKRILKIDEMLEVGMNLIDVFMLDYSELEYLLNEIEKTKKDILKDSCIASVEFRSENDKHILKVEKIEIPTLKNDYGEIEERWKEDVYCFFYDPDTKTCIMDTENEFQLLLAKLASGEPCPLSSLKMDIHYKKEIAQEITKENSKDEEKNREKLSINGKYIPDIMDTVATHAWNGDDFTVYVMNVNENTIKIEGYIYEPAWEDFSATSSISLNGHCIYGKDSRNVGSYHNEAYNIGKFTTLEEAIQYIKDEIY